MASPVASVLLQGILIATDNTQSPAPYIVNLDFQNPTLNTQTYTYDAFFQALTSPSAVTIPTPSFILVVLNRPTNTNNLQIIVQPTGGTPVNIGQIGPGGVCVLMDTAESGIGWNVLTLTGLGGTVVCSVFAASHD